MNFFRIALLVLFLTFISFNAYSDNNEEEQNIVEKAKDINKKLKEKQNSTQANIDSEIGKTEEPLPLNDPFAGDTATASTIVTEEEEEATEAAIALRSYKLAATFTGDFDKFVTLVNDSGEYVTLELFEELSSGLKLVDVNVKEAIFQKEEDGTYLIMNFKNQIKEEDEL